MPSIAGERIEHLIAIDFLKSNLCIHIRQAVPRNEIGKQARICLSSSKNFRRNEIEDEVAAFSAKCWDLRNKAGLIESTTSRHDAQVVGSYRARPTPPDSSDFEVRGLHHCATTTSNKKVFDVLAIK